MMRDSVWVTCAAPQCTRGTFADPHHLQNICSAGGWLCWHHSTDEEAEA